MLFSAGLATVAAGLGVAAPASAAPSHCYPIGSPKCVTTFTVTPTVVPRGGSVTAAGTGWVNPHVKINFCGFMTVHATPNTSDDFSMPVGIPDNAPLGPCIVTASGKGVSGHHVVLTAEITIVSSAPTVVPSAHTGEPWSGWLYWLLAGGVGLLGFVLFGFGRRRLAR